MVAFGAMSIAALIVVYLLYQEGTDFEDTFEPTLKPALKPR